MRRNRRITLGDKVEDIVTGLQGIAVARVDYLNGCVQYCVQPRGGLDALKTDSLYIDHGQLKWLSCGINPPKRKPKAPPKKKKKPGKRTHSWGGPSAHAPKGMGHP